jgi:hypothetical protein
LELNSFLDRLCSIIVIQLIDKTNHFGELLMKHIVILLIWLIAFSLVASACGNSTPQATEQPIGTILTVQPTQVDSPTEVPTDIPAATLPVVTETSLPLINSFQDPTYGFTFDYPNGWALDTVSLGSRAPTSYQLTSWEHEPGMVNEVLRGESILNITIQLWDPKNDLDAFVENRQIAWEASGFGLISTDDILLANGKPAKVFITTTLDGSEGYFLFTTLGNDYLVVSGSGDLELLDLVARSIR